MSTRPKIIISQQDARRLENLLNALSDDLHPTLADLEEELSRAEIMDEKDIPPTVVTMNSTVKFRTSSSKDVFCLTLVYPEDLDEAGKTISILAPVGGALLGLSEGDSIEWSRPGGGTLKVFIEQIVSQPKHTEESHR